MLRFRNFRDNRKALPLIILAIESSCDENSAAVVQDGRLLALKTQTQSVHQQFGGVVPELAGRSHLELIDPLVQSTLLEAHISQTDLDLIAATSGPGLVGSLMVGMSYGRGLSLALGIPFRPIHHLEAHLWSAELTNGELPLPFLILLASGGHTQMVLVRGLRDYEICGTTLDDALGEAYDKVGKVVGLQFPAGAEVDRIAATGDPSRYKFPIAMLDESPNFSFSGLKTSFLYATRKLPQNDLPNQTANLLASFQEAALKSVVLKVRRVLESIAPHALVIAGGVAANSRLRALFQQLGQEFQIPCFFPSIQLCGDNAAMIGYLAWRLENSGVPNCLDPIARPRWPLEALSATEQTQ
jgi:N6-L-threonylcarbamoyladenine synthase